MIAIVAGLGAALSWAIATLGSSRSSRMIGPMSVLAWVMIVGFVVSIPPTIASLPTLQPMSMAQIAGMAINGIAGTAGLVLAYHALVIGRVSIVTPIVSTEGAAAAVASVFLGEALGIPTAVLLGIIAIGVVLASIDRRADEVAAINAPVVAVDPDHPNEVVPALTAPQPAARPRHVREDAAATRRSVLLAIAASIAFSIGLVISARLGDVPIAWILLTSRATGVILIAIPLIVRGRLRLSRRALPLVIASGVFEVIGAAAYLTGAQASPAMAAVLSSQFAAIAAVSAFILFGERLARIQIVGVVVIGVGVAVLAVIRA
ncbi:MAG: DMT family transporter [Chloroflexota bacterium]